MNSPQNTSEITIGKLARSFQLSRSTLLYYDSIGLLQASKRTKTGYRIYQEADIRKLKKILTYRSAGMSIDEIKRISTHQEASEEVPLLSALFNRLGQLNVIIESCQDQQKLIIELLNGNSSFKNVVKMNPGLWRQLLSASGIQDDKALRWHRDFESYSQNEHRNFLRTIGFSQDEMETFLDYLHSPVRT